MAIKQKKRRRSGDVSTKTAGPAVAQENRSPVWMPRLMNGTLEGAELEQARRRFFWSVTLILLLFGIYSSYRFYGFAPFPHPDSTSFIETGKDFVSFEMPTSFKRAPVVCVLQGIMWKLLPVERPDYHAGMALNAVIFPFLVVFLWLVGRKLTGDLAAFPAVLLAVNPWLLVRQTESIAEVTMIFVSLATLYLICQRSKWAYVLAAVASMTRYDLTGWILAVMAVDLIESADNRQRIRTLIYGFLAGLPLMIWLLITYLTWENVASQDHYFSHYTSDRPLRIGVYFVENWQVVVSPLLWPMESDESALVRWTQSLFLLLFIAGVVVGFLKRRWEVLAMLAFLVPYLVVHAMRNSSLERYYAVNHWLMFFICVIGLQGIWGLIRQKLSGLPTVAVRIAHLIISVIATVWLIVLLGKLAEISDHPAFSRIMWLPVATIGIVIAFVVLRQIFFRGTTFSVDVATAGVICLMLTTSQVTTAQTLSDGKRDYEFVQLAEWFRANTEPGEKLACTLVHAVRFIAADRRDDLVDTQTLGREFIREHTDAPKIVKAAVFTKDCLEQGIDYVCWDSRLGYAPDNSYYRSRQLAKVEFLVEFIPSRIRVRQFPSEQPRAQVVMPDVKLPEGEVLNRPQAVYKYVTTIGDMETLRGARRHIHVFRLNAIEESNE